MVALDRTGAGDNLLGALRSARRTWWRRSIVDALLLAGAGAAIGVIAAWLRSWALAGSGRIGLADGPTLRLVVSAAVTAFVLGVGFAALRSPSLLEVARRVDRRLGQSGRFSTTLEVLVAGGPTNVVARALVSEVEGRAASLDVGPAGWIRRDRGLGRSVLLAIVIASSLLMVPVPTRSAVIDGPPGSGAPGVNLDPAADAETLAGVAKLLDLVAEQEDSDYLRALGASFSELAERVDANAVSAAESDRLTQELMHHLQAASQDIGGRFAQAVNDAFAMAPHRAGTPGSQPSAQPAVEPSATAGGGAVPPEEAVTIDTDATASIYSSFNALIDQFEADPAAVGLRPQRSTSADSSAGDGFYGGVLNAEADPNAAAPQPAGLRGEGQAGGAPAGAAERSSDAAGDAAGQGGADLGPGSDSFLGLATDGGSLSSLQRNEREDGRYVEMELVPRADDTAVASSAMVRPTPDFVRGDQAAFSTRGIGAEHAAVVSRYFTPGSVSSGGQP